MSNATPGSHTFAFQERANLDNFYAEVQRKIGAFGFIGHSVSNPMPDMPMPQGPNEFDVALYWGAQAWIRISAKLSAGAKVHEAVLDANQYLAQNMPRFDSNGDPIPLLSFKAIGDSNVSIR